jgi:hypothetical protein
MGIAGDKPRQFAPTVGTTGSGSTDSPAPSPTIADLFALTRVDGSSSATVVDSASSIAINTDITSSAINIDIDVDTTSPTIVGIAAPIAIDATPTTTMLDITELTIIDTAPPSIVDSAPVFDIDSPAATIIDPVSSLTGTILARTRGFDMAFGLFNFHVDSDGAAKLISIGESAPPVADPSTPAAIEGHTSTTISPAQSEEEPRLETST